MSGFRWVISPLWLSWSWRSFLYSFSVYSCHLFLISSASVAAAKSLQSFPTLCDPIYGSPPGSPIPGILQALGVGCHCLLQCMKVKSESEVADSSLLHGLQPTRLLRPWDFPGKSTGVGCHCLLCQNPKPCIKRHLDRYDLYGQQQSSTCFCHVHEWIACPFLGSL